MNLQVLQQLLKVIPHSNQLGLELVEAGGGRSIVTMPVTEHIRTLKDGPIAPGAILTLVDTALGCSVMALSDQVIPVATLDLRMDSLRSSSDPAPLYCESIITHTTREVFFVRGDVWQYRGTEKHMIAVAAATFMKTSTKITQSKVSAE